jgi:equilibrative nucleoside transporter 1/2/3
VIDDTEEADGSQPLLVTTTEDDDEDMPRPTLNKKDADPNIATMADVVRISKQMKSPAIAVWLVFAVTIGLFPALTALIESTEKCKATDRFHNDLFLPFMFIVFNAFDLVGRVFAKYPLFFTADNVWIGTAARLIFFPLFMLCNITDSNIPTLFTSDAWPVLFMTAFAFTNGYFASLSMMFGPSKVPLQDQQLSGTIMVCYLTLGLMTGAAIGFIVVAIVQG